MQIKTLDSNVSVSGQVMPADLKFLAERGIRTLICNRPDGEGAEQPPFAEIEREAQRVGVQTYYLPVTPGQVTGDDAIAFEKLLDGAAKPIHAFCGSGMRSTTLWALVQGREKKPLPEIVRIAADAGYDISGVAALIAGEGADGRQ